MNARQTLKEILIENKLAKNGAFTGDSGALNEKDAELLNNLLKKFGLEIEDLYNEIWNEIELNYYNSGSRKL